MKIRIAQASNFCWDITSELKFILQFNDKLSCSTWGCIKYHQRMEQLVGGLKATHGIIYEGTYEQ